MAVLFITCGVQGSGKTTLAKRVEAEERAIRLTADEWLHDLFPEQSGDQRDTHRPVVERLQWAIALRALENGCNVVLDWGLWTREERDRYRSEAQALGARAVDVPRRRRGAGPSPGVVRTADTGGTRSLRPGAPSHLS